MIVDQSLPQTTSSTSNSDKSTDQQPPRRAKVAPSHKASVKSTPSKTTSTSSSGSSVKKPSRDSSRKATHSEIEKRRREKINDRLVTLRSLVPACAAEIEERKRQKAQEEEEARQIAAGERVAVSIPGKRKRNRRKKTKTQEGEKEDELGLHKLEVLTHTIDYIYELQEYIQRLRGDDTVVVRREAKVDADSDDVEEESEADLEMSEWRPSVKKRVIDFNTRRSTVSSGVSSLNTSPAIMSLSADSPMFSATASSSNSAFTHLTSPMMSLSSESPILRLIDGIASPSPSRGKESNGTSLRGTGHDALWQLPAPALPLSDVADTTPTAKTNDAAHDAQLLLHLGSSPEVFRPMSALRQTYQQGPTMQRRKSTIASASKGPKWRQLARIGGSAPGGAHASTSNALVSPPLLDLDAPSSTFAESG